MDKKDQTKEQQDVNLKEQEEVKQDEKVEVIEKDEKDLIIEQLELKIKTYESEIDKIKRAAADVINRGKQLEVEKKYEAVDLIKKLLVPLSYFESALKYQSDDQAIMNFLKGFEMIYNLILDTLKSDGLEEIATNVNDIFDPYYHEVTELVETDGEKDRIVEVVQKGYKYKDRVIKPVKVKVSKPIQKLEDSEDKNNNETQDNSELVN